MRMSQEVDMNVELIREKRLAMPFQPFVLRMDDGRVLEVRRQFALGIAPSGNLWFVDDKDNLLGIDVNRVVALDMLNVPAEL